MNRKQLTFLFMGNFITLCVCSGLLPLLPLYAAELGATPAVIGNYLAIAFLGTALGSTGAGWISSRLGRRRLPLVVVGVIGIPVTWGMGHVTTVTPLVGLTALLWFLGGLSLALIGMLAGRSAPKGTRGRVFGLLALAAALGGLLGSAFTGPVVERGGYPLLLTVMAAIWALLPLCALLLRDPRDDKPRASQAQATTPGDAATTPRPMGLAFGLMLLAHFCTGTAVFAATMGRSLAMDTLGFSVTAVALAASIGSGAGLIFNPLVGRLSDRVNRQLMLALTYTGAGLALVLMASATSLSAFILTTILVTVGHAGDAVAQALVTDMVAPRAPDRHLSLLSTTKWMSGVAGFGGAGYAVQVLGLQSAMLILALLPLLAIVLIAEMRTTPAETQSAATDARHRLGMTFARILHRRKRRALGV